MQALLSLESQNNFVDTLNPTTFIVKILLCHGIFHRILVKLLLTVSKLLHVAFIIFFIFIWTVEVLSVTVPGILNHMDLTFTTLYAVVQWSGISRLCKSIPCLHSKHYSFVMNEDLAHYFMTTPASVGVCMLKCFFWIYCN